MTNLPQPLRASQLPQLQPRPARQQVSQHHPALPGCCTTQTFQDPCLFGGTVHCAVYNFVYRLVVRSVQSRGYPNHHLC